MHRVLAADDQSVPGSAEASGSIVFRSEHWPDESSAFKWIKTAPDNRERSFRSRLAEASAPQSLRITTNPALQRVRLFAGRFNTLSRPCFCTADTEFMRKPVAKT